VAEALLSIRDLRTQFETSQGVLTAVDGVSFDLGAGETLGIAGESGSGKSVLVKSLMRVLPIADHTTITGKVNFEGRDIA
jgi:ABC-type dipeptide/oligopeptide/nickel transport system ATPase component